MMRTYALTIALALLAAAAPARAQDTTLGDARWAPWLGCWHLVHDDRGSRAPAATNSEDVLVCVLPESGNRGVGMTTYVGGQSVLQQTIVADGASYPVSEPECNGSQRSEWSLTGRRLLTRADITCIDQPARTVSAITLMAAGTDVGGYPGCRHRSGRPGTRPPLPTNRPTPSGRGLAGRPPGTRDGRLRATGGSNS